LGRGRFAANVLSKRVVTLMPSQKATKKQNGKCYVLTPQRYVGAEAEALEEEEGLDEKRLHLTAKWERQFAESAKLEAMIRENLRRWSYGN
jgi:type I restriction-modification system DNA methylase subunit